MMKKVLLLVILFVASISFSLAQQYQIITKTDSVNLLIGDYFTVTMSVKTPRNESVLIPPINQDFFSPYGLEWLSNSEVDTLGEGDMMNYTQTIIVSAYDEGNYIFPSIPLFGPDSFLLAQSQPIPFAVATIPVDTLAGFKDIKNIQREPLSAQEIIPFVLLTWFVVLILVLGIVLFMKYRAKKPVIKVKKVLPKENPDITALKALDKLWHKKLWQEGKVKPYYSELTEIVRTYIEGHFSVNAMEMVSNEILEALNEEDLTEEVYGKLKEVLYTADMVKFAKWNPAPDLHARCFDDVKDFVNLTKISEDNKSSKESSVSSGKRNSSTEQNKKDRNKE